MVREDFLRNRGEESDEVSQGQGDQVAVGGGVERLGAPHRQHHHQVAHDPDQEDGGLEDCADHAIEEVVILRVSTVTASGPLIGN